jgi:hypothetical protein
MSETVSALKLFGPVARLGSFSRTGLEFRTTASFTLRIIRNFEIEGDRLPLAHFNVLNECIATIDAFPMPSLFDGLRPEAPYPPP